MLNLFNARRPPENWGRLELRCGAAFVRSVPWRTRVAGAISLQARGVKASMECAPVADRVSTAERFQTGTN
jgi:hypothetical protein